MLIISTRDQRSKREVTKNKHRKKQRVDARYSESVRTKQFCCAFKYNIYTKCKSEKIPETDSAPRNRS